MRKIETENYDVAFIEEVEITEIPVYLSLVYCNGSSAVERGACAPDTRQDWVTQPVLENV